MDWAMMGAVALIILSSGFIQGLVGFGSALVAVPLLLLLMEPVIVVPITLVHGLLMNMYLSVRNRCHIQKKRVIPLFLSACLGIPLGTLVLLFVPSEGLKVFVGFLIVVFSLLVLFGRSWNFSREGVAMLPVGLASGFLNGSVSMSGPPVILFLSNQGVSKRNFRANLVTYFFLLNIITFLVFLFTGIITEEILLVSLFFSPALPAGIILGEILSKRINDRSFTRIALLLVIAAGIAALVSGLRTIL